MRDLDQQAVASPTLRPMKPSATARGREVRSPVLPVRPATALGWLASLLLLLTTVVLPPAHALTVLTRDFDALVARAETIFQGTVIAQESLWVGEGSNRHIVTRVTFQVQETYKGVAASSQTLEFMGGTVAGRVMRVPGAPRFITGEQVVLFVVGNGAQMCPLVGAFQGRFLVERDPATAVERVYDHDHRPVVRTEAIGQGAEATVSGGAFTPKPRSVEPGPSGAGAATPESPSLSAAQFGAAIARKLQERRAQGLPEVQRD